MELTLFVTFVAISLILVSLGLYFREHTELSLIGFFLLFLLAMIILTGTITRKVGEEVNSTCLYSGNNLTGTIEQVRNVYEPITWDGSFSHYTGYYLAVISIVGFIGVLVGLRRGED